MIEWVSVKDRLPEESGYFLVYCETVYGVWHYSRKHQLFNTYECKELRSELPIVKSLPRLSKLV